MQDFWGEHVWQPYGGGGRDKVVPPGRTNLSACQRSLGVTTQLGWRSMVPMVYGVGLGILPTCAAPESARMPVSTYMY